MHLEKAWKEQQEREEQRKSEVISCPLGCVMEVQDLPHLEGILEAAGSRPILMFMYTRSCGKCKEILRSLEGTCKVQGASWPPNEDGDARRELDKFVLLKHELRDSFDDLSPVARFYRVRHAPSFLVLQDGAFKGGYFGTYLPGVLARARSLCDWAEDSS
ncbi:unnamed protein product [Pedinophyceae sp. YPF-701]|nr:unnamed protein product [Pedinophyceae sp. YPF-701]